MQELITVLVAVGIAGAAASILVPMLSGASPERRAERDAELRDQLGAAS